ncbi:uncharacterized protein ATC70_000088 [Mucor velutinosus]|uniref:Endonuclease/exonuclease/phosphatase domain-containing protein n=1 Tax=Mucor velutinosus TaxID=708070 RepID=A0AAN7HYP2_9FUNG|nr:hypothetical protein ATC70_000088 [Mucor velutinosus]
MTDYRSTIKIGSLNCRSVSKLFNPTTSSEFVRFLRNPEVKYDILCFQETHATESVCERLNMQFQTNTSIWTSHCGIVSLNPKIVIQPLNVTLDDRIIVCQVTHCNALFSPITLVNIYAPATASSRAHFYSQLLTIPLFHPDTWALDTFPITIDIQPPPISTEEPSTIAVDRESLIILGDFNYHATSYAIDNTNYTTDSFSPPIQSDQPHHHSAMLAQHRWHDLLSNHLIELPTQNMMGHFYQHSVAGPHGRPSIMSTAHQRYFNNYTRPPLILCAPNGLIMPSSIPPFNSPPLNRVLDFGELIPS